MYIVKRDLHNPLVMPTPGRKWESRAAFNGCALRAGDTTYLAYRAVGPADTIDGPRDLSTIGVAHATDDGFHSRRQFIVPSEEWDRFGCEDPRVTFFEGKYVTCYTALGGYPFGPGNIKVALALSSDLSSLGEKHLVTPFNAKAGTLFPTRVGGDVVMLLTAHTDWTPEHPRPTIAIARAKKLKDFWDPTFWEEWHANLADHSVAFPLRSDRDHVEVGAPPIKTKDGWLLIYSYIQDYYEGEEKRTVGIEALLLDLKDPRIVVGHTRGPILVPETAYEQFGIVPNVVFPSGALVEGDRLDIYYGGADTVCARASLHLPDLLDAMVSSRRRELGVRAKHNPVIEPDPAHAWESKATFNAAAIDIDGTVHILYRALSQDNVSSLGYASSKTGTTITKRLPEPAYIPRADFETKRSGGNSGCEDPRLTQIGNKLYVAYTAVDGVDPWHVALSSISVKDFVAHRFDKWSPPQIVTPDKVKDKDGCIFPEKVGGQYMLIHRVDAGGSICADLFDSLDFSVQRAVRCIDIMSPRRGMWDSEKVGVAGVPIKTKYGWLMLYHGVSRSSTYRLGAALLDLHDPSITLARTNDPIFEPVESYEKTGEVAHVVFSCGGVVRGDKLIVYYGAADRVLGVATFSLKKLLGILLPASLS